MTSRSRIGDIIEIPTKRGLAYAHYSHHDKQMGALLRVLPDFFSERPNDFSGLSAQPPRFATFFPLGAAVRRGIFEIVAHVPVPESAQRLPQFKARGHIDRKGRVHDWWICDGERQWRVGSRLRAEHRSLPMREIINDTLLIERIEEDWTPELEVQRIEARGAGDAPPWARLVPNLAWLRPRLWAGDAPPWARLVPVFRRLFGKQPSHDQQREQQPQQAVLVHLDGVGLPDQVYQECDLATIEDRLMEVIRRDGLGEFDGNEMGPGETTLFMYGPDAERLFTGIEQTLRGYPLCQGARVVIRCGGPGADQREIRL